MDGNEAFLYVEVEGNFLEEVNENLRDFHIADEE